MTQSEIVTQHFNDPIGSVMKVNGLCYVKVSNKTHVIDTPVETDENSVYHTTSEDCVKNKNPKLLCPPVGKLLFTVSEAMATATLCFDHPSMRTRPTSIKYVERPFAFARTSGRATLIHNNQHVLPTSNTDTNNNQVIKLAARRLNTRVTLLQARGQLDNMINKMVHNT